VSQSLVTKLNQGLNFRYRDQIDPNIFNKLLLTLSLGTSSFARPLAPVRSFYAIRISLLIWVPVNPFFKLQIAGPSSQSSSAKFNNFHFHDDPQPAPNPPRLSLLAAYVQNPRPSITRFLEQAPSFDTIRTSLSEPCYLYQYCCATFLPLCGRCAPECLGVLSLFPSTSTRPATTCLFSSKMGGRGVATLGNSSAGTETSPPDAVSLFLPLFFFLPASPHTRRLY
jgi:hypothetical protein